MIWVVVLLVCICCLVVGWFVVIIWVGLADFVWVVV